jgi:hypothetical protein
MLSQLTYRIYYELNFVSIYLTRLLIHKLGHRSVPATAKRNLRLITLLNLLLKPNFQHFWHSLIVRQQGR